LPAGPIACSGRPPVPLAVTPVSPAVYVWIARDSLRRSWDEIPARCRIVSLAA